MIFALKIDVLIVALWFKGDTNRVESDEIKMSIGQTTVDNTILLRCELQFERWVFLIGYIVMQATSVYRMTVVMYSAF